MGNRIHHIALIICLLCGCKETREDCFNKAGDPSQKTLHLPVFNTLQLGDRFDATLEIIGDTTSSEIIISGPENVIKGIEVKVSNGILTFEDNNSCKWIRQLAQRIPVTIKIHSFNRLVMEHTASFTGSDTLKNTGFKIEQKSMGNINLTLSCQELVVEHREAGEINLKGYAAIFVPVIYDTGLLNSREMTGDYIFVYHYGINDVFVKPFKVLHNIMKNSGNVYYYADPVEELKSNIDGTGKVIRDF